MRADQILGRIRWLIAFFIVGLVLSGVTAFPLLHELAIVGRLLGIEEGRARADYTALRFWLATVWEALRAQEMHFPFLGYGTDWLAFGHLVIALFFVPAWHDPVRYRGIFTCGLAACAGVIVIALICGPIRGIPFYWRLLDCSFGVFGSLPLFYALRLTDRLAKV